MLIVITVLLQNPVLNALHHIISLAVWHVFRLVLKIIMVLVLSVLNAIYIVKNVLVFPRIVQNVTTVLSYIIINVSTSALQNIITTLNLKVVYHVKVTVSSVLTAQIVILALNSCIMDNVLIIVLLVIFLKIWNATHAHKIVLLVLTKLHASNAIKKVLIDITSMVNASNYVP
mgnify:CR=1 FL=1